MPVDPYANHNPLIKKRRIRNAGSRKGYGTIRLVSVIICCWSPPNPNYWRARAPGVAIYIDAADICRWWHDDCVCVPASSSPSSSAATASIMQRVTVSTFLAVVAVSATSYRPPAPANVSTSPTPIGQIGTYTSYGANWDARREIYIFWYCYFSCFTRPLFFELAELPCPKSMSYIGS